MINSLSQSHDLAPGSGSARTPPDTRIYAIGDVHGRLDLLDGLLRDIAQDSENAPKRRVLVTLGDLVDRGADSAGVVERLLNLHAEPPFDAFELHFLMGNHDALMARFLDGANDADASLWLSNGGTETLAGYGVDTGLDFAALHSEAHARIPQTHRNFIHGLGLSHREGDYLFVHAGIRPGIALTRQVPDDLMWIREEFLQSNADFGCVVVHGHTPLPVPEVRPNRIGIDTKAWLSGTLTCAVLQDTGLHFLST